MSQHQDPGQDTRQLDPTEAALAGALSLLKRARLCMDNVHRDGISAGFVCTREDIAAFLDEPNDAAMFVPWVADIDITDEVAERLSREMDPDTWVLISTLRPAAHDEYAAALRGRARGALAAALGHK